MTITVDPPEGEPAVDLKYWGWSEHKFASLIGHFEDTATLWEMLEEGERATGRWLH